MTENDKYYGEVLQAMVAIQFIAQTSRTSSKKIDPLVTKVKETLVGLGQVATIHMKLCDKQRERIEQLSVEIAVSELQTESYTQH